MRRKTSTGQKPRENMNPDTQAFLVGPKRAWARPVQLNMIPSTPRSRLRVLQRVNDTFHTRSHNSTSAIFSRLPETLHAEFEVLWNIPLRMACTALYPWGEGGTPRQRVAITYTRPKVMEGQRLKRATQKSLLCSRTLNCAFPHFGRPKPFLISAFVLPAQSTINNQLTIDKQPIDSKLMNSHRNTTMKMVQKRLRTFTCFGTLPKELRDYIWELAMQNDTDEAAIHFFSVSEDLETFQVDLDVDYDPNDARWRERRQYLRAPTWRSHGGLEDWSSHRNPSGYLLDPGLWFACAESRDSILRKEKVDLNWCVACVKLPARKGSWQRHIAIRSDRDLIIFQILISKIISLPLGILQELTSSSDLWEWLPFCGIEYDPRWATQLEEEDAEGPSKIDIDDLKTDSFSRFLWEIAHVSTTDKGISQLWLVDHRTLRPVAGMTCSELGKDRITFRARGWRYFEVNPSDIGKRWEMAEGFTESQNPWHFAWTLADHPDYVEMLHWANVSRESFNKFETVRWSVGACIKDI